MDVFRQQYLWWNILIPLLILCVLLPWLVVGLLHKQHRHWVRPLALIVLMVAPFYIYFRDGRPGTPERSARKFLKAIDTFDCETAWPYFSADTQKAIEIKSEQFKKDPGRSQMPRHYLEAKNLYCLPITGQSFWGYKANSVKLLKAEGNTATVAVKEGIPTGFLIPGFWPTKTRYVDHQLTLVREGGEWKIFFQP